MAFRSQGALFLFTFLKDNFPSIALESKGEILSSKLSPCDHVTAGGPVSPELQDSGSLGLAGGPRRVKFGCFWPWAGDLEPQERAPGLSDRQFSMGSATGLP